MRRFLDRLYLSGVWLAAALIVVMTVVIMAQVLGRLVDIVVPSAAQIVGFLNAAAVCLGLAYTLAVGDHIRVSIFVDRVREPLRWWFELWSLVIGVFLLGYYTVFSVQLAWESYLFDDRADGLVAIPYVYAQSAMAIGIAVLTIRLIDELVDLIRTGKPNRLRIVDTVQVASLETIEPLRPSEQLAQSPRIE